MSSTESGSEDLDEESPISYLIHNAAETGDVALLERLLFDEGGPASLGLPLNKEIMKQMLVMKDFNGCNPLHLAILNGHVKCAELLLKFGANSETKCDGNPTLCMATCVAQFSGKEEQALQLVQLLLQNGCDVMDIDDSGRTPLHWAAAAGLISTVQPLVAAGAESQGRRLEAWKVDMEAIKAAGMDTPMDQPSFPSIVEVPDNDGNTPVHLAVRFGRHEIVRLLLAADQGWDVMALAREKNKDGLALLHIAALYNRPTSARAILELLPNNATALMNQHDRKGRTPAEIAAKRGHVALSRILTPAEGTLTAVLPPNPTSGTTLLVAPEECLLHHTAPEPMVRGVSEPPPENVNRLKVLTTPGSGVLHTTEFSSLQWETQGLPSVAMADLLRCHDWSYVHDVAKACMSIEDHPSKVSRLDPDTAISHHTYLAALKAAGAVCHGVDKVMSKQVRNVFCAVRPPGHHAGPQGVVANENDPHGSHGFCLFSNVAVGASYAMNVYRHQGIKRVAILDFDVHHGNGTQAVVANTHPSTQKVTFTTPFSEGVQLFPTYKPWLDTSDSDNILFASVQGYGKRGHGVGGWFYPGSGATADNKLQPAPSTDATGVPAASVMEVKPDVQEAQVAPASSTVATVAGSGASVGGQPLVPEDPNGEFHSTTTDTATMPASGPRIINVGVPGPGGRRLMWRRAWRDKILPAVINFRPDLIILSAGFDAHKKEDINLRYVGVTEHDYEWLTDQIVQVANRCCDGRLVSVLEGGYNLRGGYISAFARSVAAHVRGLAEAHSQIWDPAEYELERQLEARKKEAAAVKAHSHEATTATATAAAAPGPAVSTAAGAAAPAASAPMEVDRVHSVTESVQASTAVIAAADTTPVDSSAAAGAGAGAGGDEPAGKRRRRGAPVDYAALNAQMEAEKQQQQ